MESELEKFRQKKRVEKYKSQIRSNIGNWWSKTTGTVAQALLPEKDHSDDSGSDPDEISGPSTTSSEKLLANSKTNLKATVVQRKILKRNQSSSDSNDEDDIEEVDATNASTDKLFYFQLICKVFIWICLFMGFVKLELGSIYFILSVFWLMWRNTATKKKSKPGPSAYSVFNPNCEAINGTLKAEDLEKHLLFRETK